MKNQLFNEPVQYQNDLLSLKIWQVETDPLSACWHYHKELEILYIIEGSMEICVESETYLLRKQDVVIIGSSEPHFDKKYGDEQLEYIVFQIDLQSYLETIMFMFYSYFAEFYRPLHEVNYIFQENEHARIEAGNMIMNIYTEMQNKEIGYEIAVTAYVKRFLLLLLRNDTRKILQEYAHIEGDFIRPLITYIDNHLHEKVHLEHACSLVNMSYFHFSRTFKKFMGQTFTEYVNSRRINKAGRLLLTKNNTISEIAESVGIPNSAHFYELFKRYKHCSPKEYIHKLK